jgi:hypothetical protein
MHKHRFVLLPRIQTKLADAPRGLDSFETIVIIQPAICRG